MLYCLYSRRASHVNGLCDEYAHDNVKSAQMLGRQRLNRAPCANCRFTEYAHALVGMRGRTCDEYQLPALAVQDELFPLEQVVKLRGSSMEDAA